MLIGFILGVIAGDLVTLFVLALCQVQEDDEEHDQEQLEWLEQLKERSEDHKQI